MASRLFTTPIVEPLGWWRVDTTSNTSSPAAISTPDGSARVYGRLRSDERGVLSASRFRGPDGVSTLYLKRMTAEVGGAIRVGAAVITLDTGTLDPVPVPGANSSLTLPDAIATFAAKAGATVTGAWDFTGATVTGVGGGGAATLLDRGAWATTTVFAVGDAVTQAGQRYACRTAHTSGTFATDLAAAKWVALDVVAAAPLTGAHGIVITLPAPSGVDDTAVINAAIAAAKVGGPTVIVFAPGIYVCPTVLTSMNTTTTITFRGGGGRGVGAVPLPGGNGSQCTTELRYTGGGSGIFVSAVDACGFTVENMAVTYSSSSFTGNLIAAGGLTQAPSYAPTFRDAFMGSTSASIKTATVLNFTKIVEARIDNCAIFGAAIGIDGTGAYSNSITMTGGRFDHCTAAVVNPRFQWVFDGVVFEPGCVVKTVGSTCEGLTFTGCGWWDNTANPWVWIDVAGSGIAIVGGYWEPQGGSTETLIKLNGAFDGVSIHGLKGHGMNGSVNSPMIALAVGASVANLDLGGNSLTNAVDGLAAASLVGSITHSDSRATSEYRNLGSSGASCALPLVRSLGVTLSANCTLALPTVTSGSEHSIRLRLRQDGTGSRTATWPSSVVWGTAGAPTLTTTAANTDLIELSTVDGGTNWLGRLAAANVGAATATAPGVPTGLSAASGSTQVTLSWTAPADTGGSAITDYVIGYRTPSGSGSYTVFSDGTSTAVTATITGLTNGTAYGFHVAAVNAIGTGSYTAEVTGTPGITSGAATDNFDRANAGSLGTSSDSGHTWTSGPFTIVGNQAAASAAGVASMDVSATDVVVTATVAVAAAEFFGVLARSSSDTNFYMAQAQAGTGVNLYKCVAGAFTQLGTTQAQTVTNGDTISISVSGSTIKAIYNGVDKVTVTDSSLTSGTRVGMRSSSTSATKRIDNFAVAPA